MELLPDTTAHSMLSMTGQWAFVHLSRHLPCSSSLCTSIYPMFKARVYISLSAIPTPTSAPNRFLPHSSSTSQVV